MTVDLAIIIPTLNEEHFIGKLLDSIINQTVLPKEIVVVDACSNDRTIEEVEKRLASRSGQKNLPGLRFFRIPKSTISAQRNFGAKKTKTPYILFLDADTVLKETDALEKYFKETLKEEPDIATAFNLPLSNYWKDRVFFRAMKIISQLAQPIWPMITGMNIFLKRGAFEQLKGFDEGIRIGEDADLVQRAAKLKLKFIFLKTVNIYASTRRLRYEGRIKYVFKLLLIGRDILFYGKKNVKTEYEFGHFNSQEI